MTIYHVLDINYLILNIQINNKLQLTNKLP
ncbi:hypothetical protein SaSA201_0907 [Streptococcus agalactiae]|nr:hypothetical protein SaSA30_0910 [Streptococcus agalactiae]AUO82045.1 hypothetical protein SaSA33_0908 [Streptococcus agalactiae]AUO86955.1 hypothetical protein SaSA1_0912 [Streptococcus agalactiae]AUO88609.1 hypothetical protein SaSA5_0910 [Streptococcus agalactiae]AUO90256.1 hypothetical protein SaSA9_0911 [Streptococcus agalactiae]